MKTLFRFPIFNSRFTVSRHRALREAESEFSAPVLWFAKYSFSVIAYGLVLAFLAALIFFSCGGDDGKKDGGSSSGGSAKARVEAVFEEWRFKACEVDQACPGMVFVRNERRPPK